MGAFEVVARLCAARGTAGANPQFGSGGAKLRAGNALAGIGSAGWPGEGS